MSTATRNIVTVACAVMASLGAQSQLHVGERSMPAQHPSASPAQVARLHRQLMVVRLQVADVHSQLLDSRAASLAALRSQARVLRQSAALAEHVASLEASSDPQASTVDFQRSIAWKNAADQIDPGD